ncbi:hypothetical protein GCM10020227_00940 [Streptomyces flavovirens]
MIASWWEMDLGPILPEASGGAHPGLRRAPPYTPRAAERVGTRPAALGVVGPRQKPGGTWDGRPRPRVRL